MIPLVSIVIPAVGRPQYLPRAIDSALANMDPKDVEVIVVPNGPDESWREALQSYHNNQSVRTIRIMEANANAARNAGLDEARGEFVRFLDDDDYLIPKGAIKQYEIIKSSDLDVVSGSIQLIDEKGRCFDTWHQPDMDDFCSAILGPWRITATMAHVYRHSSLENVRWNPKTLKAQDLEWLFDLCAAKDLRWYKTNEVVGVWYHHWNQRISPLISHNEARKNIVGMLVRTHDKLYQTNRLNQRRQGAIAHGLWGLIHAAFFLEPRYWVRIADKAKEIDPSARPIQPFYYFPIINNLNPLLIQQLMLPKRWLTYHLRQMLEKLQFRHRW